MKIEKALQLLFVRKWLVLAAIGLITLVASYFASRVVFDSSIEIWFLENDPDLIIYHEFLDRFVADEVVVMGVFADDIFTPEVLASIKRITKQAKRAPYVHRVTSLSNIRIARGSDGYVSISPLFRTVPRDEAGIAKLRQTTLENDLLAGSLVAENGKAAAILVEIDPEGSDFDSKIELVTRLNEIIAEEENEGLHILLSGSPVMDEAFFQYTQDDFTIFAPIAMALVIFLTFMVFRRLSATLIPLSVVVIANIWVFGVMGALDVKINVISTALIVLTLAVGVASSIHILADYYQQLMAGLEPEKAVRHSITQVITPCFFTSATTAAGMLSLMVSDLKPVHELAWLAALAVIFSFLISFTLVPLVLHLAKPPDEDFIRRQKVGPISRMLHVLGHPTRKSSAVVLVLTFIFLLASAYGLTLLNVGSNPVNYFKKGDPVLAAAQEIDKALGGSITIEGMITAPNAGLKDPQNLQRIDDLERWLEDLPGVTKVLSPVDSLKELNRVFHDGDRIFYRVPDTRELIAQYYLLMEGESDFDSMIQQNYSIGRLTARAKLVEAQELSHQIPALEAKLHDEYNDEKLQINITGFIKLMSDMEKYLLDSQIQSFSVAFGVITIMMFLLLGSVRLALFSMIPNLTPIALGLAFMAAAGISLDPGTVMIGSIALGLVVDDTVHFLVRLHRRFKRGLTLEDAISGTMDATGRPIIITSMVLSAGFLVLMLGSFAPNIYFGLVTAIIVVLALVCDLIVLPAALIIVRPNIKSE
jgi:uncharacterized protein